VAAVSDRDLERLVDPEFWDEEYFWADQRPPLRPDPALPFDRMLMRAFARYARPAAGEEVVELGCAPAKWLVHLGETYGAKVEGIEYTAKGAAFSRANLAACGVDGAIVEGDVFALDAQPRDLALSLGFIEHFDDLDAVFARHLDFVRPGGRLVIGVPNFTGINGWLQGRADRAYLDLHNRDAMRPALYRRLAAQHGLQIEQLRHLGGPDPVIVRSESKVVTFLVLAESRVRRLKVTEELDHRLWSSYLLGVFRRPPAA
jgi:SAM-dependent methyltransferase